MAKIRKGTVGGKTVYFATVAQAVKDVNFKKADGTAMTQAEINAELHSNEVVIASALTEMHEKLDKTVSCVDADIKTYDDVW